MAERKVVGEAYISIKPDGSGFEANLKKIIAQYEKTGKIPVSADTAPAEKAVRDVGKSIEDNVGKSWQRAATEVAAFTGAVYGVKQAIDGIVGGFSNMFDTIARAQFGFQNILNSPIAGDQLLDQVRELGRTTPFATEELVKYSQQLLGVGISAEKISPLLTNVGDLVASVGGDTQNISRVLFALSQVQSAGRLVGQDALQLQQALIPIQPIIANYLDITTQEVKDLQRLGQISSETVFAAISQAGAAAEGAMDDSVKTISGQLEILRDTIQTTLVNPTDTGSDFYRIYEGVQNAVKGLVSYLESPEVQAAIKSFEDALGSLYDALQPVFEQIRTLAARGALTALKSFTSVLQIFANIVDAIPEPALRAITTFFVAMATLRAPLMMIQYVTNIQRIGSGLLGGGLARSIAGTTVAIEAQGNAAATAAQKLNTYNAELLKTGARSKLAGLGKGGAAGALASYGPLALTVAGSFLSDGNGGARDIGGSILTSAGMGGALGAAVGSVIPGLGTAVGAAVGTIGGAAVGAVTSITSAFRKNAEEAKKALEEYYQAKAQAEADALEIRYGSETDPRAIGETLASNSNLQRGADGMIAKARELQAENEKIKEQMDSIDYGGYANRNNKDFQALNDALKENEDRIKALNKGIEQNQKFIATFSPEQQKYLNDLQARVQQLVGTYPEILNQTRDAFNTDPRLFAVQQGNQVVQTTEDWNAVLALVEGKGFDINDLMTKTTAEVIAIADAHKAIPTAIDAAITKQKEFLALLEKGQTAAENTFKAGLDIANAYSGFLEQGQNLSDAFSEFYTFDRETGAAGQVVANAQNINAAGIDIISAAQAKMTQAIAAGTSEVDAQVAALNTQYQLFENLQEQLNLSDGAFQSLLTSAGLWEEYTKAASQGTGGFTGTLAELESQYGLTEEKLREVLNLQGEINPYMQIVIDADVSNALGELSRLRAALNSDDPWAQYGRQDTINRINELEDQLEAAGVSPTVFDPTAKQREEAEKYAKEQAEKAAKEAERLRKEAEAEAERQRKEAERAAEEWQKKLDSATDTLTTSIQSAADSIKQAAEAWMDTIKERTEYERAVSVSSAIRNTNRQIADIATFTDGVNQLKARGVSEAVLSALGIDGLEDTKQIRKLLGASDADLATLTAAVGQRDAAATALAEQREQENAKNAVRDGVLEAYERLGFDPNKEVANNLSAELNITAGMDAESLALQLLSVLAGGKI